MTPPLDEEGKTFEEGQRSLRECLNSARKSEETIAIGLYNFSGERRSQMSLKKKKSSSLFSEMATC